MTQTQLKVMALTTIVGGVLGYLRVATAQPGALQITPLAQGFSPERHIQIKTKGPSDVLQTKLALLPMGEIGWHTHPGAVILVVTGGALTEYNSNGCVSVHQAGSVLIEEPGEVHRVVNHSATTSAEGYGTFILPTGAPPLVPVDEPKPKACKPEEE